jgi:PKD repeat protein
VSFTDHSLNNPTSWSWIFGDGGTSTLQNPAHLYKQAGVYSVQLTANGATPAVVSKTGYITVTECANGQIHLATTYLTTLLEAYTNAASIDTIEMQAVDFTEWMVFDKSKTITLKGGFNCNFSSTVDYTMLNGVQKIRSGKVIMERIKIK